MESLVRACVGGRSQRPLVRLLGQSVKSLSLYISCMTPLENREQWEEAGRVWDAHEQLSYCSSNFTGFIFGLSLVFIERQWDFGLRSRSRTWGFFQHGKRWVSCGAACIVLWEFGLPYGEFMIEYMKWFNLRSFLLKTWFNIELSFFFLPIILRCSCLICFRIQDKTVVKLTFLPATVAGGFQNLPTTQ